MLGLLLWPLEESLGDEQCIPGSMATSMRISRLVNSTDGVDFPLNNLDLRREARVTMDRSII